MLTQFAITNANGPTTPQSSALKSCPFGSTAKTGIDRMARSKTKHPSVDSPSLRTTC